VVVTQRDKQFRPGVVAVAAGTAVRFDNADVVLHNVYSTSEPRTFDLGMRSADEPGEVVFDRPGRVDLFCAVHTQMHAVVMVVDEPLFGVTDAEGRLRLRGVAPGIHALILWHPVLGEQGFDLVVPEDAGVRRTLRLEEVGP
jgi:hypothetical protein